MYSIAVTFSRPRMDNVVGFINAPDIPYDTLETAIIERKRLQQHYTRLGSIVVYHKVVGAVGFAETLLTDAILKECTMTLSIVRYAG